MLGIAFHMLIENEVHTKHYCLKEIKVASLTSQDYVDAIMDCLREDGMEEDVRLSMVAFLSDGASVNIGTHRDVINVFFRAILFHCIMQNSLW